MKQLPRRSHESDVAGEAALAHQDRIESQLAASLDRAPWRQLAFDQAGNIGRVGRGDVALAIGWQLDAGELGHHQPKQSPAIATVAVAAMVAKGNPDIRIEWIQKNSAGKYAGEKFPAGNGSVVSESIVRSNANDAAS